MISFSNGRQLLKKLTSMVGSAPADFDLRADLAGLLTVSLVSSYENAVKKILIYYADGHNDQFSFFVEKQFEKLNSRISLGDLKGYAKKFDEVLESKFENELARVKVRLGGQPVEDWYDQLLQWRHAFAHAGQRTTTLEEVYKAHQFAKYVLFAFHKAFCEATPAKKSMAEVMFNKFLHIKDEAQTFLEDSFYLADSCCQCRSFLPAAKQHNIEISKIFTKIKKQKKSLDFYGMQCGLRDAKVHLEALKLINADIYAHE